MRALVCAALIAAGSAHAELVFKTEGAHVVLSEAQPCSGKVADLLLPEWRDKFKAGYAVIQGRALRVCWIEQPEGAIVIIDEDGDGGRIEKSQFKQAGA